MQLKFPWCPFHIWLPQAHVEAPTAIAFHNFSRFITETWEVMLSYKFCTIVICVLTASAYYADGTSMLLALVKYSLLRRWRPLRQTWFKTDYRLFIHCTYEFNVVLGIFSSDTSRSRWGYIFNGWTWSCFLQLYFFVPACSIWSISHTWSIKHYSGLVQVMPLLLVLFFSIFLL